jgi:Flp pilus assembly protein TadG
VSLDDGHVVTPSAPAVLSQARLQCFLGDERGSVAIIFALALIPLTLAVGAAVDYSLAARIKAKLDAAADAAALAAVNKSAMGGNAQAAQTAAARPPGSTSRSARRKVFPMP